MKNWGRFENKKGKICLPSHVKKSSQNGYFFEIPWFFFESKWFSKNFETRYNRCFGKERMYILTPTQNCSILKKTMKHSWNFMSWIRNIIKLQIFTGENYGKLQKLAYCKSPFQFQKLVQHAVTYGLRHSQRAICSCELRQKLAGLSISNHGWCLTKLQDLKAYSKHTHTCAYVNGICILYSPRSYSVQGAWLGEIQSHSVCLRRTFRLAENPL